MKKSSEYIKFLGIGFCAFIIAYLSPLFIPSKISQEFNDLASGCSYFLSKKSIKPLKIIGIVIDDYTLNRIQQRWPWKRSLYAKMINILNEEKVRTIGIDLEFKGESEDKNEDTILKETLNSVAGVVLAYSLDYERKEPVLPFSLPAAEFRKTNFSLGMLNTPKDKDGKVRRLRTYVEFNELKYHSFSVVLAASFLRRRPEEITPSIPVLKDKTYYINYLLKPKDILRLRLYDILERLHELKAEYGESFLKDSLVLVYSEAEILHDKHLTPLGELPGGTLHLNGVVDILTQRFTKQQNLFSLPFFIISFLAILYFLKVRGFGIGLFFTFIIVLVVNFGALLYLGLKGIRLDFFRIFIFNFLFFFAGSLYKYINFLMQISKLKNKATVDPLRKIYTLRYFYNRIDLEQKEIYFNKDLFLVFIHLKSFREQTQGISFEKIKYLWEKISSIFFLKRTFWAAYSQEEIVGCLRYPMTKMLKLLHSLRNNLAVLFQENDVNCEIKLGYLRYKKGYPLKELLFVAFSELKQASQHITFFNDTDLVRFLGNQQLGEKIERGFLGSLDEDIEEKNRQLLELIEKLENEHTKTKEAFFQIITSLVNALEARDPYTQGHSQRVCDYGIKFVDRLGWTKEEKDKFIKASLLHDIGKIGIQDSILHKKGRLTEEEFDFIKKHEVMSVQILEPLKDIKDILPWILHHHERWDGKGYPYGLAGNAIPLASQILTLVDVFDALTTGRDYKKAFSWQEALEEIVKNKGTQFNPQLVDIFVEIITASQK